MFKLNFYFLVVIILIICFFLNKTKIFLKKFKFPGLQENSWTPGKFLDSRKIPGLQEFLKINKKLLKNFNLENI